MDKEIVAYYTQTMKYYSSPKEDSLTFATTWIKLENIMLSEIRDTTERKKNA